jgi:citrate lyase subunit beta/citryl-CoA lyase
MPTTTTAAAIALAIASSTRPACGVPRRAAAQSRGQSLGAVATATSSPKVAVVNEVFAPTASDVDWARRVIKAHADATARGHAVVVLDGRLIENLHVDDARRVLILADAIAARATG